MGKIGKRKAPSLRRKWGGGLWKHNIKKKKIKLTKKRIAQLQTENPDGAFYGCEFCRRAFKTENQVKSFHNQHAEECARWSASTMNGDLCFYLCFIGIPILF